MNRSSRFVLWFITWSALPSGSALAVDVEFRIIPLLSPGIGEIAPNGPPSPVHQIPSGSAWIAEIWGSDLNDPVHGSTGLIAAYLDVFYTPGVSPLISAQHGPLFPAFLGTEPTIDPMLGDVLNLGGVTPRLDQPKGIAPDWVRIGQISYGASVPSGPTSIHLSGRVGIGGVGCYGRSAGDTMVVGADVLIVPYPPLGVAAGAVLTAVAGVRRRPQDI